MYIDLDRRIVQITWQPWPERELETIYFPMGEVHLRLPNDPVPEDKITDVFCRIRNSDDLVQLLLLSNALDKRGIAKRKLIIPYLPYARQDRVAVTGEPHSLQMVAGLLDNLGFEEIVVVDVHSNIAEACFTKTKFTNYKPFLEFVKWANLRFDFANVTLIAPDEGAFKRTGEYLKYCGKEVVPCFKKRDPETGALTGFEVMKPITTKEAIIIDDICDGGGTFLGLAPKLKEAGAEKLYLWVTPGGFTKGFDAFLKEFNEIGCTDSYKILLGDIVETKRVTQISINYKAI